jgi:hypothetical protein
VEKVTNIKINHTCDVCRKIVRSGTTAMTMVKKVERRTLQFKTFNLNVLKKFVKTENCNVLSELKQEKIGKGAKDPFNLYYQENTVKGQKAQGPELIRQTWKKYTNNIISLSVSSKMITKVILAESVNASIQN